MTTRTAHQKRTAAVMTALLAPLMFAAIAISGMTHEGQKFNDGASPEVAQAMLTARGGLDLPALDRVDFPNCVTVAHWKATHRTHDPSAVPATFVVVRLDGSVERMSPTETWKRIPPRRSENTNRADDVWPIGACD